MSFEKPNYTQAPNTLFDELLPQIDNLAELKVTLVAVRQTVGFHKDEDEISLSRFVELTGLHRETVVEGIRRALKRKTIARRKAGQSYLYRLNVADAGAIDATEASQQVVGNSDQPEDSSSREFRPEVVGESDQQVVGNSDPQKKVRKKEKESTPVGAETSSAATHKSSAKSPEDHTGKLIDDLEELGYHLDRDEVAKISGNFGALKRKGVSHPDLVRARQRMVSEWPRIQLSPQKALSDVTGISERRENRGESRTRRSSPNSIAVIGAKEEDYDIETYRFHA